MMALDYHQSHILRTSKFHMWINPLKFLYQFPNVKVYTIACRTISFPSCMHGLSQSHTYYRCFLPIGITSSPCIKADACTPLLQVSLRTLGISVRLSLLTLLHIQTWCLPPIYHEHNYICCLDQWWKQIVLWDLIQKLEKCLHALWGTFNLSENESNLLRFCLFTVATSGKSGKK